jgi:transcriptional regulator with XRE-family HTH domain
MKLSLKNHRLTKGLTQQELGDMVGLSRVYISALERGVRKGPVDIWDRLESALGVDQKILRQAEPKD